MKIKVLMGGAKSIRLQLMKTNYYLYSICEYVYKHFRPINLKIENKGVARFCKDVIGNGNSVVIGKGSFAKRINLFIRGNNNSIIVGQDVRINGTANFRIVGDGLTIKIGNGCSMNSNNNFNANGANITVGKECMISNHITIRTSDDHPIFMVGESQRINPAKNVTIGDHVWLTPQCIIMKGVNVGSGSIIATRALVTHDVPENCIAAGIPAKVTKTNVYWKPKE